MEIYPNESLTNISVCLLQKTLDHGGPKDVVASPQSWQVKAEGVGSRLSITIWFRDGE